MNAMGEGTSNSQAFLLHEDSPMIMGSVSNQRWCYATAKQMLERWIFAHSQSGTLPYTIIRPFNLWGPKWIIYQA
jgi:UDP-apiose/xylose synthase